METQYNNEINPGGINGTGEGVVNVNHPEFIALKDAIVKDAQKQTPEEKIHIGLLSLKYQMESYLQTQPPKEIVEAGTFLKKHLEVIRVKHKVFAAYVGIEESNLSSILRGRRRVNVDLAYKLGKIFNLNPDIWLLIQSKNDLLKMDDIRRSLYDGLALKDLLKKAGK